MTITTKMRATLIGAIVLVVGIAAAQVGEDKSPFERPIDCIIYAPATEWRNNADTLVHIRLKNRTDQTLETEFNATLYLTPHSKFDSVPFWSPIDLAHDTPAPTDRTELGGGVAIKLKAQPLRITPHDEVEFTIHAANMKWQRQISSAWPDSDIMRIALAGDYSLKLTLDTTSGATESNTLKVSIVKK